MTMFHRAKRRMNKHTLSATLEFRLQSSRQLPPATVLSVPQISRPSGRIATCSASAFRSARVHHACVPRGSTDTTAAPESSRDRLVCRTLCSTAAARRTRGVSCGPQRPPSQRNHYRRSVRRLGRSHSLFCPLYVLSQTMPDRIVRPVIILSHASMSLPQFVKTKRLPAGGADKLDRLLKKLSQVERDLGLSSPESPEADLAALRGRCRLACIRTSIRTPIRI